VTATVSETTLDAPVDVRFTAAGTPLAVRYDGRVWAVAAEPLHWFTRDSWWETQRNRRRSASGTSWTSNTGGSRSASDPCPSFRRVSVGSSTSDVTFESAADLRAAPRALPVGLRPPELAWTSFQSWLHGPQQHSLITRSARQLNIAGTFEKSTMLLLSREPATNGMPPGLR
jgi:hypothetical protein